MIYIHTALKSEAQGIIEKYKLSKHIKDGFNYFANQDLILFVSGIGVENAQTKTTLLLKLFEITINDTLLNIGICGANKSYQIGDIIAIDSIFYKDEQIILNKRLQNNLTCLDLECSTDNYDLVDMESYGFYQASKELKNVKIFKIVSDHFEPEIITKEFTKKLIFNNIEKILGKSK